MTITDRLSVVDEESRTSAAQGRMMMMPNGANSVAKKNMLRRASNNIAKYEE